MDRKIKFFSFLKNKMLSRKGFVVDKHTQWRRFISLAVLVTYSSSIFSPVFALSALDDSVVKDKPTHDFKHGLGINSRGKTHHPALLLNKSVESNHEANKNLNAKTILSPNKYLPYFDFGGFKHFNQESGAASIYDLFIPLLQKDNQLLFADLRIFDRSGGSAEGNLHFGYRKLYPNTQQLFGIYGAFDYRRSPSRNSFRQLTLGLEYWYDKWFVGGNIYKPIGQTKKLVNSEREIDRQTGRAIATIRGYEKALSGIDAELGYAITDNFTSYAGGYYFAGGDADTVAGPKVRLAYDYKKATGRILGVLDEVSIEAGIQRDNLRKCTAYVGIKFKVGLSNFEKNSNLFGFERHMVELVRRDPDIIVTKVTKPDKQKRASDLSSKAKNEDVRDTPIEQWTNEELLAAFGLPADTTFDEVKARYNELAKKHHPDKGGKGADLSKYNFIYDRLKKHYKGIDIKPLEPPFSSSTIQPNETCYNENYDEQSEQDIKNFTTVSFAEKDLVSKADAVIEQRDVKAFSAWSSSLITNLRNNSSLPAAIVSPGYPTTISRVSAERADSTVTNGVIKGENRTENHVPMNSSMQVVLEQKITTREMPAKFNPQAKYQLESHLASVESVRREWTVLTINKIGNVVQWICEKPKIIIGAIITAATGIFGLKYFLGHKGSIDSRKPADSGGGYFWGGGDFPRPGDDAPSWKRGYLDQARKRDARTMMPVFFTSWSGDSSVPILVTGNSVKIGLERLALDLTTFEVSPYEEKQAAQSLKELLFLEGCFRGMAKFTPLSTLPDWNYRNSQRDVAAGRVPSTEVTHERRFNANLAYEYEDQDINVLLPLRAQEAGLDLINTRFIAPLADNREQLQRHLTEERFRYRQELAAGRTPFARTVLVPVNLYNLHWVGMVIYFNEHDQAERIQYIDPLGNEVPTNILAVLQDLYGRQVAVENLRGWQQTDGMACGPLTVENMLLAVQGELQPRVAREPDIAAIRHQHLQLLEQFAPEAQFNFRQGRNIRSIEYTTASGQKLVGGLFAGLLPHVPLESKLSLLGISSDLQVAAHGGMKEKKDWGSLSAPLIPAASTIQANDTAPLGMAATEIYAIGEPPTEEAESLLPSMPSNGKILKTLVLQSLGSLLFLEVISGADFGMSIILSQIDEKTLAASGLITTMRVFFKGTFDMLVAPAGIFTGSAIAAKENPKEIGKILRNSWKINLAVGLPTIALFVFSSPILQLLGQDREVADITQSYFRMYAIGFPFALMLSSNFQLAFGLLKPQIPFTVMFLQRAFDVGFGYVLAHGKLGLPRMGAMGAGISSAVASTLAFFGSTIYLSAKKEFRKYKIFARDERRSIRRINDSYNWQSILKMGIPIALLAAPELAAYFVCGQLAGLMGTDILAATEITFQYSAQSSLPSSSISQTTGILIARYISQKNIAAAVRSGNLAIGVATVVPAVVLVLYGTIPNQLVSLFSKNPAIMKIARTLLLITGVNQFADALRWCFAGSLRGGSDVVFTTVATSSVFILGVLPLEYVLGFPLPLSIYGTYGVISVGSLTVAGILGARWIARSRYALAHGNFAQPSGFRESCRNCWAAICVFFGKIIHCCRGNR